MKLLIIDDYAQIVESLSTAMDLSGDWVDEAESDGKAFNRR